MGVEWEAIDTPSAKYKYAAFVGSWSEMTKNDIHCPTVFPNCPHDPKQVTLALLTPPDMCLGKLTNPTTEISI